MTSKNSYASEYDSAGFPNKLREEGIRDNEPVLLTLLSDRHANDLRKQHADPEMEYEAPNGDCA